jgi:hypothetical protein
VEEINGNIVGGGDQREYCGGRRSTAILVPAPRLHAAPRTQDRICIRRFQGGADFACPCLAAPRPGLLGRRNAAAQLCQLRSSHPHPTTTAVTATTTQYPVATPHPVRESIFFRVSCLLPPLAVSR